MAYIFESTNTIRIIFIDLTGLYTYSPLDFSGFIDYKPKDENQEYISIDNEIFTNNIGMRMIIDVSIINRVGINLQSDILRLFKYINWSKLDSYLFRIYPSYDSAMLIDTLDCFTCIVNGYYEIEKLHKCLKAGHDIKLSFKQRIPNKLYIPGVPSSTSTSLPYEQGIA